MYDPVETEFSYQYLGKLGEKLAKVEWGLIGGWAVYFHVRQNYQRAFGEDYLKSRDIDVFIDSRNQQEFLQKISELGFTASAYNFRYELIYEREEKKIITPLEARKKPIFHLIYLFLDVFSDQKTALVGSWVFPELEKGKWKMIESFPVMNVSLLLHLKVMAFFQREKLDKELKDACDIYALLFYSQSRVTMTNEIKKAVEKIISRADLQRYIAEQVLKDSFKEALVVNALRGIL